MSAIFHSPDGRPMNYFKWQIIVLKILGISFSGDDCRPYVVYSVLWLGSVALTYTIVELYEMYIYKDDLDTISGILSYLVTDILGVAKLAVLIYNRILIGRTLNDLEEGQFAPNLKRGGPTEEKLIKQCISTCNLQTSVYYTSIVIVISFGVVRTLYQRLFTNDPNDWQLPFVTFSWFDVKRSPNYEIVWLYQVVWRLLFAFMVCSTDLLIAGLLAHISTQCKILQNAIRKMVSRNIAKNKTCDVDSDLTRWEILQAETKSIVEYHLAIVKLAEEFEELFNVLALCVFSATLGILCFAMYHASMFDLLSTSAAQDLSYVGLILIQVFMYCFWGNEVTLESQNVASACWEAGFVGTDVRFQKSLAFIIRRCQKPIVLTAGKFGTLSLETYARIIRASYSYYMVLRSHKF